MPQEKKKQAAPAKPRQRAAPKAAPRHHVKSPAPRPAEKPARRAPKVKKTAEKPRAPKHKLSKGSIGNGVITLACKFRLIDRRPVPTKYEGRGLRACRLAAAADPKVADQLARIQALRDADAEQHGAGHVQFGAGASAVGTGLSDCAAVYAKAIANPFGTFDMLPCVPCSPPVESQRVRSLLRGTFATGTGSCGYLLVAPYVASYDGVKVASTTTAFAGTIGLKMALSAAGEIWSYDNTLPYTNAQMAAGISARLVGLGLRFRNITQASNVGGMVFAGQVDDATTLVNTITMSQFCALPQVASVAQAVTAVPIGEIQNNWSTLVYRPQDMESLDFSPDNGTPANTRMTLCVVAVAPAGAAQTFEYEIVEFFEYTGYSLVAATVYAPASVEVSHADSIGLDRVLEAAQRIPLSLDPKDWVDQTAVGVVGSMAHSDSAARTVEDLVGLSGLSNAKVGDLVSSLIGFLSL